MRKPEFPLRRWGRKSCCLLAQGLPSPLSRAAWGKVFLSTCSLSTTLLNSAGAYGSLWTYREVCPKELPFIGGNRKYTYETRSEIIRWQCKTLSIHSSAVCIPASVNHCSQIVLSETSNLPVAKFDKILHLCLMLWLFFQAPPWISTCLSQIFPWKSRQWKFHTSKIELLFSLLSHLSYPHQSVLCLLLWQKHLL